ncbi:MAG: hypothetical protein L3J02_06180 [Henriciella sp.]|nr:hypothetical protein [Henriciella sp.]
MTRIFTLMATTSIFVLASCTTYGAADGELEPAVADTPPPVEKIVEIVEETEAVDATEAMMPDLSSAEILQSVLDAQSDEAKARYGARNPAETLAFFGIEPGMTVVEALPGGGWYSKILMSYLGPEGTLVGAQYPGDIWRKLRPDATEEVIAGRKEAAMNWPETVAEWGISNGPTIKNYHLTKLDESKAGLADAVLYIRALHNLNRADEDHATFKAAISESYGLLKPGGVAGVVQHRAPEANSDEWAVGSAGYLKQSYIIDAFEAAGFVLEEASEINANALDKPSEDDIVWRLPPARYGTDEDTPERAAIDAIGESDRMTLKFRKPASNDMMDAMMDGDMEHKMDHMKDDATEAVTEAVEDAVEAASDAS